MSFISFHRTSYVVGNKKGTNLGVTEDSASFSLCLLKLVTRAPITCPLDESERLCSSRALRAIARFSFSALFAFFSESETTNLSNRERQLFALHLNLIAIALTILLLKQKCSISTELKVLGTRDGSSLESPHSVGKFTIASELCAEGCADGCVWG